MINASLILRNLQVFFTEILDVYEENPKGEYGLVGESQLSSLNESIQKLKSELRKLKWGMDEREYNELIEIIDNIDYNKLSKGEVNKILETAKILINKNATLKISNYETKQRGGDLAKVIQVENGKEKTRGGIILPKEKSETEKKVAGKYIKNEEADKIVEECMKKVSQLSKAGNFTDKNEAKKLIRTMVKDNKSDLTETIEKSAQTMNELHSVKKVQKKYIFLGAYRAAIVGLSAGLLASMFLHKNQTTVVIQAQDIEKYNIANEIGNEVNDTVDMIDNNYTYENGMLQEAQILGKIDYNEETEVIARENRISSMESIEEMQQNIENIQSQYTAIEEPSNVEWIEYQLDNFDQYGKILDFHDDMADQGIENLEKWSEYNQEHINKGKFSEETKLQHESEINYNENKSEEYKSTKEEIEKQKHQIDDRSEFYKKFKNIENIENIKDIESTIERIYDFSKSNLGKEVSQDDLLEMLKDKNIELFANLSDQINIGDSLNEFMENYAIVEHSYNMYVKHYCDGNNQKSNENKYVQYIKGIMQKGQLNKVENGKFGGISQIDRLNEEYYTDYGKEDLEEAESGIMTQLSRFLKRSFDVTKISDYNQMMKEIKEIRSQDNTKDNKGDSEYDKSND